MVLSLSDIRVPHPRLLSGIRQSGMGRAVFLISAAAGNPSDRSRSEPLPQNQRYYRSQDTRASEFCHIRHTHCRLPVSAVCFYRNAAKYECISDVAFIRRNIPSAEYDPEAAFPVLRGADFRRCSRSFYQVFLLSLYICWHNGNHRCSRTMADPLACRTD